jgi:hypothetical protein
MTFVQNRDYQRYPIDEILSQIASKNPQKLNPVWFPKTQTNFDSTSSRGKYKTVCQENSRFERGWRFT